MAAPRKSQLYLHSILPVTRSHDQVVSDKLKPGKFVVTPTGITKALGLICLLAGITFFLSSSMCSREGDWKIILFSITNTVTVILCLSLYLTFSFGLTVKKPWVWVKVDISVNIIFPLLGIIVSVFTTVTCNKTSQLHNIPLPLVIAGNVIMLISTATLFLLYRYIEDDDAFQSNLAQQPKKGRVSIFA